MNVSGWKDGDKEKGVYRDYFVNAEQYAISNYKSEARGFQGFENEFFLNLEEDLDNSLLGKFDVVFNHTVLEHVFDVHKAFKNLCSLSKDVVILVVPFLQKMHADYGDYWRFTPSTIKLLFEKNNMHLQYLSFNSDAFSSVYVFAIGVKNKDKWEQKIPCQYSYEDSKYRASNENFIGVHAVVNPSIRSILEYFRAWLKV